MNQKTIAFTLAAAITIGGGAALLGRADAQDAPHPPPPPAMMDGPYHGPMRDGMHGPMMHGPMMQGPMMHGPMAGRWRMMRWMRQFALIYPAPDRNLSGPDVQKIAEAFLLFNGNHSWKITEVTEEPDQVRFAIATPDGTAIAHFAMNRHTGRPTRLD